MKPLRHITSFPGAIEMIAELSGDLTDKEIAAAMFEKYDYEFSLVTIRRARRKYIRGDESLPPSTVKPQDAQKNEAHRAINAIAPTKRECCLCKVTSQKLVYHHPDYNRPTWVAIVCRACHAAIHKHEDLGEYVKQFAIEHSDRGKIVTIIYGDKVINCHPMVFQDGDIIRIVGRKTE